MSGSTHEHEQTHADHGVQRVQADHDVAGAGRESASAKLTAPAHPIASGLLFRKARDENGVAAGAEDAVASAAGSAGSALPDTLMRKFESSLGTDLSSVRVHTGGASAQAAEAVGARAYTMGQDIHFGAGQLDAASPGGQHLIAHEVAHTVQQRGGSPTRQNKLNVSSPFDAAEHEADRAADAMVVGRQASIAGAPPSAARMIQREKEGGEGHGGKKEPEQKSPINEKNTFELPELPLGHVKGSWINLEGSVRGKATVELQKAGGAEGGQGSDIAVGPSGSTKGKGISAEMTLASTELKREILGLHFDDKTDEKFNFIMTTEKLEVSVSKEGRASSEKLPWLKVGGDMKFIFAGVDWKKMQKNPKEIDVLAADFALVLGGEGTMPLREGISALKGGVEGSIGVKASPNWAKIGAQVAKEVAKQGVKQGAKAAVEAGGETALTGGATAAGGAAVETAIAVDVGAVAGSAAALIAPLAAGALMIAGAIQEEKNTNASKAAIAYGLKMRTDARAYAKAYATTIAGPGSASGQGAADANAIVLAAMAAGDQNREQACADLVKKAGGHGKLEADILAATQARLYAVGVATFEDKFSGQFGVVEKLGETWGMRGTFRKDFYRMLYADQ